LIGPGYPRRGGTGEDQQHWGQKEEAQQQRQFSDGGGERLTSYLEDEDDELGGHERREEDHREPDLPARDSVSPLGRRCQHDRGGRQRNGKKPGSMSRRSGAGCAQEDLLDAPSRSVWPAGQRIRPTTSRPASPHHRRSGSAG